MDGVRVTQMPSSLPCLQPYFLTRGQGRSEGQDTCSVCPVTGLASLFWGERKGSSLKDGWTLILGTNQATISPFVIAKYVAWPDLLIQGSQTLIVDIGYGGQASQQPHCPALPFPAYM